MRPIALLVLLLLVGCSSDGPCRSYSKTECVGHHCASIIYWEMNGIESCVVELGNNEIPTGCYYHGSYCAENTRFHLPEWICR